MQPLVTAIIPTYRRPEILERSVGSVLAQTWRPLELVVLDDESGDRTPEVLRAFEPRFVSAGIGYRWVTLKNMGAGLARNEGMKLGRGEFFAFLDDDDAWLPAKFERQIPAMLAHPQAGVSFTQYTHAGKGNQIKPPRESLRDGWVFPSLCDGSTKAHVQTLVIRRAVFETTGGFRPLFSAQKIFNFQDSEFNLRASLEFEYLAVSEPLTVVHSDPQTMSRVGATEGDLRRDHVKLSVLDDIEREFRGHARFDAAALKIYRARLYDEHVKHLLWLGRVREARLAWRKALDVCGRQPLLLKLRGKLLKAGVAGWLGLKLRKPKH